MCRRRCHQHSKPQAQVGRGSGQQQQEGARQRPLRGRRCEQQHVGAACVVFPSPKSLLAQLSTPPPQTAQKFLAATERKEQQEAATSVLQQHFPPGTVVLLPSAAPDAMPAPVTVPTLQQKQAPPPPSRRKSSAGVGSSDARPRRTGSSAAAASAARPRDASPPNSAGETVLPIVSVPQVMVRRLSSGPPSAQPSPMGSLATRLGATHLEPPPASHGARRRGHLAGAAPPAGAAPDPSDPAALAMAAHRGLEASATRAREAAAALERQIPAAQAMAAGRPPAQPWLDAQHWLAEARRQLAEARRPIPPGYAPQLPPRGAKLLRLPGRLPPTAADAGAGAAPSTSGRQAAGDGRKRLPRRATRGTRRQHQDYVEMDSEGDSGSAAAAEDSEAWELGMDEEAWAAAEEDSEGEAALLEEAVAASGGRRGGRGTRRRSGGSWAPQQVGGTPPAPPPVAMQQQQPRGLPTPVAPGMVPLAKLHQAGTTVPGGGMALPPAAAAHLLASGAVPAGTPAAAMLAAVAQSPVLSPFAMYILDQQRAAAAEAEAGPHATRLPEAPGGAGSMLATPGDFATLLGPDLSGLPAGDALDQRTMDELLAGLGLDLANDALLASLPPLNSGAGASSILASLAASALLAASPAGAAAMQAAASAAAAATPTLAQGAAVPPSPSTRPSSSCAAAGSGDSGGITAPPVPAATLPDVLGGPARLAMAAGNGGRKITPAGTPLAGLLASPALPRGLTSPALVGSLLTDF